ncbi:MAG TPA: TetR/AcrR family transcriptional regulator [Acidimicrobiales bacterium]
MATRPRSSAASDGQDGGEDAPVRRRYDSPVRRAQAAQTRERILVAGAELVHADPRWDWRHVTVRAVAAEAGVNERTVYRHFASERELHDAVIRRLEEEAGEPIGELDLDGLPEITARVFEYLGSFAFTPRPTGNTTLSQIDQRRRDALRGAIEAETVGWTDTDRAMAAAVLDVLWTVNSYDRLTTVWHLDPHDASRAVAGVVGLVVESIRRGERPWSDD